MQSSQDDNRSLESDLREFLDELCVEWGFCIRPGPYNEISRSSSLSAEGFAGAVLQAEGMNPVYEQKWFRRLSDRFAERFGEFVSTDEYAA